MNVLVIGKAKTGTTIISKTVQKSIQGGAKYFLEPKEIGFFEQDMFKNKQESNAVKIIFEHWNSKPRMRNAIVHNEAVLKFDKVICIIRDMRDEIISRLLYLVYPYKEKHGVSEEQKLKWLDILHQKEKAPKKISFITMAKEFEKIFHVQFLNTIFGSKAYLNFLNTINRNKYILKYEDFIYNKLGGIEKYLGFNLTAERSVDEFSRTQRSGSFNNWKKVFVEEDLEYFKSHFEEDLNCFGYDDWLLEPCHRLDSKHYSRYVDRLIG